MTTIRPCPRCWRRFEIEEREHNYVIFDNGHRVTSCPVCLSELIFYSDELHVVVRCDGGEEE